MKLESLLNTMEKYIGLMVNDWNIGSQVRILDYELYSYIDCEWMIQK